MAQHFIAGSSHTLTDATQSPVSGYPCTLLCRYYIDVILGNYVLVSVGDVDTATDYFILGVLSDGTVWCGARSAAVNNPIVTVATVSLLAWHTLAAVFDSATARAVYLDGGNKVTGATSVTPTAFDNVRIGATADSTPATYATGYLAEVTILNVAATDDEIAAHAKSMSPSCVWPRSKIAMYKDLTRDVNRGWGATLAGTVYGVVAHPPVRSPVTGWSGLWAGAGASGTGRIIGGDVLPHVMG